MDIDKQILVANDVATIKVNPSIYSLDVIYSAAYVFLDRAYIILDGNPKDTIEVKIKPKEDGDPKKLALEFFNELTSYSHYKKKTEDLGGIRQAILQRALLIYESKGEAEEPLPPLDESDFGDVLDDPEGIAIPWEEKHGKPDAEKKE